MMDKTLLHGAAWMEQPDQDTPLSNMEFLTPLDRIPRSGLTASSLRCGKFQPLPCRDMHHQI